MTGFREPILSVLLPVPWVDALIDEFRIQGDWSRALGVPAHITLAGPWPLSKPLPRERLCALAAEARNTRYRLNRVDLLGDAICLMVEDERPLLKWRERLLNFVAAADGMSPEWRPHLTICRNEAQDRLEDVRAAVGPALPLDCEIRDLCIAQLTGPGQVLIESL